MEDERKSALHEVRYRGKISETSPNTLAKLSGSSRHRCLNPQGGGIEWHQSHGIPQIELGGQDISSAHIQPSQILIRFNF